MKKLRDLISQVNSIEVLMFIHKNPGTNQRDIIIGEGQNSKRKRLKEFVDAGLIQEIRSSEGRTNMRYYLTAEGENFVKKWILIENGEEVEPMDYDAPAQEGHTVG